MPKGTAKKDKGTRALDEIYKDGRVPTLKEVAKAVDKDELKLVSIEFPSVKQEEQSAQISQDEFEFYLVNRLRLAELEKTLAVNYGEIKGALDTAQSVSSYTIHYTTIKWMLEDDWPFNLLERLKDTIPDGARSSTRLLALNSLVSDTMQFIRASYPDRASFHDIHNAEELKDRLQMIGNAIGEIRSRAEARLISSMEKDEK